MYYSEVMQKSWRGKKCGNILQCFDCHWYKSTTPVYVKILKTKHLTTLTQGRAQFSSKHANISLIKPALQCPVSIQVSSAAVITHWRQTHRSERKHKRLERQCQSRLSGLTSRPPIIDHTLKGLHSNMIWTGAVFL